MWQFPLLRGQKSTPFLLLLLFSLFSILLEEFYFHFFLYLIIVSCFFVFLFWLIFFCSVFLTPAQDRNVLCWDIRNTSGLLYRSVPKKWFFPTSPWLNCFTFILAPKIPLFWLIHLQESFIFWKEKYLQENPPYCYYCLFESFRFDRETESTNQRVAFHVEPMGTHLATGGQVNFFFTAQEKVNHWTFFCPLVFFKGRKS